MTRRFQPSPRLTPDDLTVVLGGGPAGLTAGYLLAKRGFPVLVLEAEDQVGGIAKTVVQDGFRFDLGGHRFFTKSQEVDDLWHEVMREEFLLRPRMSRIYWNGKYLDYPLNGRDVIQKLGPVEVVRSGLSYTWAAIKPKGKEETFEQWVSNRFGKRLFELFFRSYTEKVWGVPTSEIRAEWAAQRIKGLSFWSAAKSAFVGNTGNVKSLITEFHYPRFGPGQMWETMTEEIERLGGEVRLNTPVTKLHVDGGRVVAVEAGGEVIEATEVVSSLPLRATAGLADPPPPAEVVEAARGLRYRDFLTVALVIDGEDPFPDNWIYIHEPSVQVGRIQNFRSWSPWMVPDPTKACVGLEYFCFAGDDLWTMRDEDLVELAARELEQLGLARREQVERGFAVRVPKAYPMYDADYSERVDLLRGWLDRLENFQQVGRNGLHRYNNSDHSMLTAIRAVENILDDAGHDIWAVNAESVYHETDVKEEQPYRNVPAPPALNEALAGEAVLPAVTDGGRPAGDDDAVEQAPEPDRDDGMIEREPAEREPEPVLVAAAVATELAAPVVVTEPEAPDPLELPVLTTPFRDRPALIVADGAGHREDLRILRPYVREAKPVLVGVDGGADSILAAGFVPDLIVGHSGAAGEPALRSGAELVLHDPVHGAAPARDRLDRLGLDYKVVPAPVASHDVAMMIAAENGAQRIVTVGSHPHLSRLPEAPRDHAADDDHDGGDVDDLVVDATGLRVLQQPLAGAGQHLMLMLTLAALVTSLVVLVAAPGTGPLLDLVLLKVEVLLGLA